MAFAVHYMNPNTKKIACATGSRWGWTHQVRDWTSDKEKVTCKHCLSQVQKWAEREKNKG